MNRNKKKKKKKSFWKILMIRKQKQHLKNHFASEIVELVIKLFKKKKKWLKPYLLKEIQIRNSFVLLKHFLPKIDKIQNRINFYNIPPQASLVLRVKFLNFNLDLLIVPKSPIQFLFVIEKGKLVLANLNFTRGRWFDFTFAVASYSTLSVSLRK